MTLLTVIAVAVLAGVGGAQGRQADPLAFEVVTKRFLRGDATLVDAFCRVPFGFLTPADSEAGVYRVGVEVEDSAGMVLHTSGWSQSVAAHLLGIPRASTVEHFAFSVASGTYTLSVSLADSVSGAVQQRSVELASLGTDSRASDLLLSTGIRRGASDSAPLGPGEIQKGSLFLSSNTRPVLTPHRPELSYYIELYPGQDASVEFTSEVFDAQGHSVTSTAPEMLNVKASGGVSARSLSLAGLPVGDYRLHTTLRFPDRVVTREAAFRMSGLETEQQIARVGVAPTADDPFAAMTEARLDSLYGPLMYLMERNERGVYEDLSLEAKRNYMREFWDKRDPTPGTAANEMRDAYYALFAEANRRYRESGAGDVPGWRTDRGRIFLKQGEPEAVLQRPSEGLTPPYEVWKYTRPRMLKYVFLDETGLGNFALIYTNDRFETSRGNWEALLGAQAVADVLGF